MSEIGRGLPSRLGQILRLAAMGRTDREIASELGIKPQTVESHWKRLRELSGASSRTAIVAQALERFVREAQDECESLRRLLALEREGSASAWAEAPSAADFGTSESARLPDGAPSFNGSPPANLFQVVEAIAWHPVEALRAAVAAPPDAPVTLKGFTDQYRRCYGPSPGPISARRLVEEILEAVEAGKQRGIDFLEVSRGGAQIHKLVLMLIVRDSCGSPEGVVRVSWDLSPWVQGSTIGERFAHPVFR